MTQLEIVEIIGAGIFGVVSYLLGLYKNQKDYQNELLERQNDFIKTLESNYETRLKKLESTIFGYQQENATMRETQARLMAENQQLRQRVAELELKLKNHNIA